MNNKGFREQLSIRLSEDTFDKLLDIAHNESKSMNEVIRDAIDDYLQDRSSSRVLDV